MEYTTYDSPPPPQVTAPPQNGVFSPAGCYPAGEIIVCNPLSRISVILPAMQSGLTDNDIIQLVQKGDQQAYAQLVSKYQNYVFTIILRYIPSREDAEEVAQDVFVKAYRSLADFRGESKFSTWLYTITTTTSISFLRKNKLEVQSLDNEKIFAHADNIDGGLSANQVEQKSKIAMVNQAIKLLSPDDAQVITLFYKGEQSLEEIAQILGQETNNIKVRLHRARQRLKEKMEKYFTQEVKDLAHY